MFGLLLPAFFLYLFGIFNLLGTRGSLVITTIIHLTIGVIVFFIVKKIGLHFFRINATFFYWLFIGILIATYIIGLEAKGSKRWIDLYVFNFQASEFFKVFFIIFFANLLAKKNYKLFTFGFFLSCLGFFLLPTLIIFKQPDLGSAMVFVFIFIILMIFSDIPKKYLLYFLVLIVVSLPITWNLLHTYQRDRILSFLNPHVDTGGTSYNMTQAIITIGSGKFLGKGLGLGTQSSLFFLPENHTDFAFSSLIEQFGFIGGTIVIILYIVLAAVLLLRIFRYYHERTTEGRFKYLYTLGFFSFIIFQVFVNIGMNLGIMPITGIPLPLISYGGSALITTIMGLAILP